MPPKVMNRIQSLETEKENQEKVNHPNKFALKSSTESRE